MLRKEILENYSRLNLTHRTNKNPAFSNCKYNSNIKKAPLWYLLVSLITFRDCLTLSLVIVITWVFWHQLPWHYQWGIPSWDSLSYAGIMWCFKNLLVVWYFGTQNLVFCHLVLNIQSICQKSLLICFPNFFKLYQIICGNEK